MRQVSKEGFYEVIGKLNCHPSVRGRYDDPNYGSDFKTPDGKLVGRTVAKGKIPQYKPEHDFLP